jgi:hypothetical protein
MKILSTLGVMACLAFPASKATDASKASAVPVASLRPAHAFPAAAPVRFGLLWLELEPGDAQVALDGEFLDRGVWLISLRPGLHDLAVRKEGFQPYHRRVGIGPGESLRLKIRLESDIPE